MRQRSLTTSLNGGEISPRLKGRVDLDLYDRAVEAMVNFMPTIEGPAAKRPGTEFITAAAPSSTWISRFLYSATQAYVIEWLETKLRFFTNGGQILDGGLPYEVTVPFTAAEAPRVSTVQSFDRLYCAHASHPPGRLTRTGAETFTYEALPIKNGPFKQLNDDKDKVIVVSGSKEIGGLATLTCTAEIFEAGHVGAPFMMEAHTFGSIKAWEPGYSGISVGEQRKSDGKVYKAVTLGSQGQRTGTVQPTHFEGKEWDGTDEGSDVDDKNAGGIQWEYLHDRFGVGTIEEVTSPTVAKIRVTRRLPEQLADAAGCYRWAHGCFSDAEGWPDIVRIWQGRLVFIKASGGNGIELIGSVFNGYLDFSPVNNAGLYTADMGFRRPISATDAALWAHNDKHSLLIGTATQELLVAPLNRAAGVSDTNLNAEPQSEYGSASVWPVAIGTSLQFVQAGARKIRGLNYTFERERFVGPNQTVFARHITRSGIKWMAFQQEPEEILWCGRNDGKLTGHPHNPEQDVKGFARAELGEGTIIAGVVVPSEDGTVHELWLLAELDGTKGILKMAAWWEEDPELDEDASLEARKQAFFVDWGVSYDGAPLATFTTGLDHLEGKTVRAWADGVNHDNLTVTGGSVTLPMAASVVRIGIGYQARIKLLPPEERGAQSASVQGLRKIVRRLLARLVDTTALVSVGPRGVVDKLFRRPTDIPMNQAAPLFTGLTGNITIAAESDRDAAPELVSDDAGPAMVTLLITEYETEDRR